MCINPPMVIQFLGAPTSAQPIQHASQPIPLKPRKDTFTEASELFTVCTQCKRVLIPSLRKSPTSIRLSRDDEEQWMTVEDIIKCSQSSRNVHLSHGLCNSCFNHMDASLSGSSSSYPPSKARAIVKSTSSPRLPSKQSGALRVLVVDDNRLQRQIHKRMVEHAGYDCDVATSGTQALEMVKKNTYCLILMDLMMGDTDGWSTTAMIRSTLLHSLGYTNTKIVACTGLRLDAELTLACKEAGMDDVVQKPLSQTILKKLMTVPVQAASS